MTQLYHLMTFVVFGNKYYVRAMSFACFNTTTTGENACGVMKLNKIS